MNRPYLLPEILADEIHAAAAERYAPRGAVPARCALAVEQTAAGFAEVASAGNSDEATVRHALPEEHSGAGSPEAEPAGNSDETLELHARPEAHSDAGSP